MLGRTSLVTQSWKTLAWGLVAPHDELVETTFGDEVNRAYPLLNPIKHDYCMALQCRCQLREAWSC